MLVSHDGVKAETQYRQTQLSNIYPRKRRGIDGRKERTGSLRSIARRRVGRALEI